MALTTWAARRLTDYSDAQSLGARFRRQRMGPLIEMMVAVAARKGQVSIIDVGGTEEYWNILPPGAMERWDVHITIANIACPLNGRANPRFEHVEVDGCDLRQYADRQFDIAHANSVIEHVGDWDRMVRFASEIRRLASAYFVQTPNYWFPVEPHCMTPIIHWLPKPARIALVRRYSLGHWPKASTVSDAVRIVESARLLNRPMMSALFPDATLLVERVLLLPKSIVAVRSPWHGRPTLSGPYAA